jgi:uncharacterized protein YjbI with pentapeptide repeats
MRLSGKVGGFARGDTMTTKHLSWWQKIKQHPLATVLIALLAVVIVLVVVLVILGYIFNWDWTGLNATNITSTPQNITKTIIYQPEKTLWDWLQLLIIPLALAIIAFLFNRSERKNEQRVASNNQQETALQEYIKEMSELLLHERLRESKPEDEERNIARARTLTVLRRLDAERKASVLQFLFESGLIYKDKQIIDLDGIDLREADLSGADLRGADLSEADLSEAVLYRANLCGASLRGANLRGADLTEAQLGEAVLLGADLSRADLTGADLGGANLSLANLSRADLSEADLSGARLRESQLLEAEIRQAQIESAEMVERFRRVLTVDADLSRVYLRGADLSAADLSGAIVTQEQLDKARSLDGATMPDGSKHPRVT